MIPALAVGLLAVITLSYVLGLRERRRLGTLTLDEALVREPESETVLVGAGSGTASGAGSGKASVGGGGSLGSQDTAAEDGGVRRRRRRLQGPRPEPPTLRPKLYWFNALLTVALLSAMIMEVLPIPVLFLLGAALALTVNFPHIPRSEGPDRGPRRQRPQRLRHGLRRRRLHRRPHRHRHGRPHGQLFVDTIPDGMGPHMAWSPVC